MIAFLEKLRHFVASFEFNAGYRLTPVDVVAEKQVVGLWWKAAVLEESQEIRVLAVDVSADLQRRFQLQQDRLLQENLARLQAKPADLLLGHADGPVGFGAN